MKAFVILELMNHMALVARRAKERGFLLVVCNHDPLRRTGPFAVPEGLVDELITVQSWSDSSTVNRMLADVAGRYDVGGTYAGFEATLPYEATLREMAGLPNNGAVQVETVLNKGALRRKLFSDGLSNLQSVSLTEAQSWTGWGFAGPAVLKPAYGTGSALCFRVSSLKELEAAAALIEKAAVGNQLMKEYIVSHDEFVLEEQADGELLSVESLVCRGHVRTFGLMGRYTLAADPVVEMGLLFPYHHPRSEEIVAKAEAFHRSAGVFHGPTHIEVMVPPDGPIELIDFNVRLAGVGSIVLFSEAFGASFAGPVVDLACGLEPDLSFLDRPTRYAAEVFVLPAAGTSHLHEVTFPPGTLCQRITKDIGQRLSGRADQLDHVAVFALSGDECVDVHQRAIEARRRTMVNGSPLGDDRNNVVAFSPFFERALQVSTVSKESM